MILAVLPAMRTCAGAWTATCARGLTGHSDESESAEQTPRQRSDGGPRRYPGRATPQIGAFGVVGAGVARLRRDPRVAADRNLRLRCRPAASCSTTSAPWSYGAARRSRAKRMTSLLRSAGFSAARARSCRTPSSAEVLKTGRADPQRGGDGRPHRRHADRRRCSTSIR